MGAQDAVDALQYIEAARRRDAVDDPNTLVRIATEVGLPADATREVLNGTAYAEDVREEIHQAAALGATGVPFFVFDRTYGISGTQAELIGGDTLIATKPLTIEIALADHQGLAAICRAPVFALGSQAVQKACRLPTKLGAQRFSRPTG